MKTNNFSCSPQLAPGQVPFLFRQKSLLSLTGETLRPGGLMLTRRAIDFCDFTAKDRILDAGCGYGMTARFLKETHGAQVTGTDLAQDMLMTAAEKSRRNAGFPLVQSRLPDLPFAKGSFTGIFCECVLSLVRDQETCLREFYRLLSKNGRLVLTDLYMTQRQADQGMNPGRQGQISSCLEGASPLIDLMKLIEKAGFTIDIIEDHTRLLRQLAGQMIFDQGKNFLDGLDSHICNTSVAQACKTGRVKPGYYLMVAAKYE